MIDSGKLIRTAKLIQADIENTDSIKLLEVFSAALAAYAASPSDETQAAHREALTMLHSSLEKSWANKLRPTDQVALKHLNGEPKLGLILWKRIETALQTNASLPAAAGNELKKIRQEIVAYNKSLGQFVSFIETTPLGEAVEAEAEARKGWVEVGFILPDAVLDDSLESTQKELNVLNRHLRSVAEVVGERTDHLLVRELSKGSLTAIIATTVGVGFALFKLAEKGIDVYGKYLTVRKLKMEIDKQEFDASLTADLEAKAEEQYHSRLREEARSFVANFSVSTLDEHRKNELSEAIFAALKHIVYLVDRGAQIEVRLIPSDRKDSPNDSEGSTSAENGMATTPTIANDRELILESLDPEQATLSHKISLGSEPPRMLETPTDA